jgi:MFS family permease
LFPLMWIFVTPSNYWWILLPAHLLSAFDSAIGLTSSNLLLKLSPRGNNASYLSTYTTIFNLACATSPLLGGWLVMRFAPMGTMDLPYFGPVDGLKILFFLSAITRFSTAWTLERLHEPDMRSVGYMFRVLREVKGFVPNVTELNQTFGFWFSPLEDMVYIIRRRGQKITTHIKQTVVRTPPPPEEPVEKTEDVL